jgi:membrane fusion protein (multidrug efflux system)
MSDTTSTPNEAKPVLPPSPPPPPVGKPPAGLAPAQNGKRRKLLIIVFTVIAVIGLLWFLYHQLFGQYHESTDDAYVGGNVIQITSQIQGTVIAICSDNTSVVDEGHVLVRLDPADAQVAVDQATATLASQVRMVRQLFSDAERLRSQVAVASIDLQRADEDLKRREQLTPSGALSTEDLQHARLAYRQAGSNLTMAQAAFASADAQVSATTVSTHPQVLLACAHLRQALLDLSRTTIVAPVGGIVDRRNVQVGQRIAQGQSLMSIIPQDQMWIDANFKEVQLQELKIGQDVTVSVDANASDVTYHGRVVGLGAGTGAAFAVLPAQNASGNWIKVVQRLPVRIGLLASELRQHPLRIGLSADITVHLDKNPGALPHDLTGQSLTDQTTNMDKLPADIETEIAKIIAANLAVAAPAANGHPGSPTR